jgi:PAS domain S-box-containing protein
MCTITKRRLDPLLFVFLVILVWQCGYPVFALSQPQVDLSGKNVLILHTLESSTPLSLETNRGLLDTLRIGGIPGANLFFESMDLRRNPSPKLRKPLVEQMRLKWSHRKADMVITVYPEALEFVLNDCMDVFPHVPIIALHLPQNFMMTETGRRIIGHFPTYDITGTIDIALKLLPMTTRVYVVSGVHKVDKWLEDETRRASKKWARVEFLYLSHMPVEDILAAVSKARPGSVILYLALTQDVAGKSHTGLGLAHQLSQVSTVPVFGMFETALGYGITGGSVISWELIGKRAGQLVIDILKGVKTLDDVPPVLDVPSVPMFDWRQLKRWNLSVGALPKGSIVINREVTLWDFKYYILGGIAILLVQTVLVIGLLLQKRRKEVVEKSLRQRTEELDQFFKLSLDLLCIANTDGYFLRLNPAWQRIFGYSREELMAKQFLDFVHPDDLDRTGKVVSVLSSHQSVFSFENRYRCKDGTYRWLEWCSAPVGNLIYAAARDITEHKRAEQALEDRLLFETLLAEISARFVNLPADQIDGEIEGTQRRICEFLDLDRSSLWQVPEREPGTLLLTHIHQPQGGPPIPERLNAKDLFPWTAQKVLAGETVTLSKLTDLLPEAGRDRESYGLYGTKSVVAVSLSVGGGPIFGLLTFAVMREERDWPEPVLKGLKLIAQVFANALARKQAEQALRESEARLSLATNAAGAGLWIMEPDTGRVWVTPKTRELFLFASDEDLNDETFFEAVYPEDRERVNQAVQQALQSGKNLYCDYRIVQPDGSIRWIVARGQRHLTSAGEPIRMIGVSMDITERKQAEEALEDRLRFEQLLSGLSARFVNIPPDRVDSEIENGLRRFLEFFQVDHCALLQSLPGKTSWKFTHVASSNDVPPLPTGVELPRSIYPWGYEKLAEKHEVVSISRLDDLPAEANVDRQTCIEWGIRSYVTIPISIGESVDHIIHVNAVTSERVWPEELFPRLRLLGEIFVNALGRKRAEEAYRESERILRQNESDLRKLAGRLIYAQEEERTRLARDLHDDLAQRLAVFAIDIGRLEQQLMDPPAPVREKLREMKNGIVTISQDVHSLSRQLHPSILDDLGIIRAVESECTSFSRREGIKIVFNHENIPRVIPKDVSLSLYRIIQEGLNNISKHACANHTSVSLKGFDQGILLSIQDDGIGFDSAKVKNNPGLGFSSMRERARLIHGEFSIDSQPEKGTVITVKTPLDLTTQGEG